jgi:hypothetical protein
MQTNTEDKSCFMHGHAVQVQAVHPHSMHTEAMHINFMCQLVLPQKYPNQLSWNNDSTKKNWQRQLPHLIQQQHSRAQ